MKTYTIDQIREALIKTCWNVHTNKPDRLLYVTYPNEVLLELVGKESLDAYYISDKEVERLKVTSEV